MIEYEIGRFIGSIAILLLIVRLFEWAFTKRVMKDPVAVKLTAVALGYAFAGLAFGFGHSRGIWTPTELFVFFLPALVIGGFRYRSGMKARAATDSNLAETFS